MSDPESGGVPWCRQTEVFTSGYGGYHTYRIPPLAVATDGTVLAFCEGRKSSHYDWGEINIVLRRSTDSGASWQPLEVVAAHGDDTTGNPCVVVDRDTGAVWLTYCQNNDGVYITRSEDSGVSWSEPREITPVLGLTFFAGALAHRQGLVKDGRNAVGTLLNDVRRFPSLTEPAGPRIVIDIGLKQLRKIEAKREEALQRRGLFASKEDYVPAQLRFEGRAIPIEMRLKGDHRGHYNTDKWSFRIKLKGQDHVLGMRRFSIQHPQTRIHIDGWSATANFRNEGILAPRSQFVTVTLNGVDKGVYNLEEFFAKEMLEAQGRRDGAIVAFDEDNYALRIKQLRMGQPNERMGFGVRIIDTFASGKVQRDPALVRQRDEAVSLLRGFQQRTLRPSEVFDARQMGRYLAIVELWSAPHGESPNNMRFYYNAVTAKLEPIAYDLKPGHGTASGSAKLYALGPSPWFRSPWTNEVLKDPVIAKAYVEELKRIASEGYLRQLEEAIGEELEQGLKALHREWPDLTAPWEALRARQIVVLEAGQPSFWEHTVVESTHGIERGAWTPTGGITFCRSPITLLRTHIAGSAAEDAVNVIHSSFRFDESEFSNTVSDAFDGDFTHGLITRTSFHDIAGDAIDVSGSNVTVRDVLVRDVGDKAVSASEFSYVQVTALEGDNVGIGVASKDRSRVSISNSTLSSFVNAGLAAYTKKSEYAPGSIIATNVTLGHGSNQTLVQTGSWIRMDGRFLGGTDLDVDALYEAGVLGN